MIVSPDKKGNIDGVVYSIIKDINSSIPLVPITILSDYEFNPELNKLDKYILFDFCEYGWDWDRKETHIFGANTNKFKDKFNGNEWHKFDEFVKNNPAIIYFKRELLIKDYLDSFLHDAIEPIEFPCFQPSYPIVTKEEFDKRPIEVFFSWGHSHEARRILHGEIFINAAKKGYGVVDNFTHFNESIRDYEKVWASIYSPYFARIDMPTLLNIQGQSKLSVSLPGAGVKCFRNAESPINSVMVMQEDDLVWSYDWIDGVNCIKIPKNGNAIETIEQALQRDDLYDIYVEGVKTCEKYMLNNYVKNYIEKTIEKYL